MATENNDSQNYQSVNIPIAELISGNSAPNNPTANNPLRAPVAPSTENTGG
jgi:hypothetical protein